jgi:hypothetical protein
MGSWAGSRSLRAALLPGIRVNNEPATGGQGHYWCEVYLDQWRSYEPFGSVLNSKFWFAQIIRPYINRPDGLKFTHIELYRETKSFSGTVKDTAGNPLDGAIARIKKSSDVYPAFSITSSNGKYDLKMDLRYTRYVSVPIDKGFSGALTLLKAQAASMPPSPADDYKLVFDMQAPEEIVSRGKPSCSFPGNVDFFICDSANYSSYTGGGTFDAFEISKNTGSASGSFVVPAAGNWYVVISNEDKARATEGIRVSIKLYKKR